MDTARVSQLEYLVAALSEKVNLLEASQTVIDLAAHGTRKLQSAIDSGDTAWMLASSALVLFMTMPGLALFYGGVVRTKNVCK